MSGCRFKNSFRHGRKTIVDLRLSDGDIRNIAKQSRLRRP